MDPITIDAGLTFLAVSLAAISYDRYKLFCCIVASSFVYYLSLNVVVASFGASESSDPTYFLTYAITDLFYINLIVALFYGRRPRLVCWCFFSSLTYNSLVFLEYWLSSNILYDMYEFVMSVVCALLLLLLASSGPLNVICRKLGFLFSYFPRKHNNNVRSVIYRVDEGQRFRQK